MDGQETANGKPGLVSSEASRPNMTSRMRLLVLDLLEKGESAYFSVAQFMSSYPMSIGTAQ